jgi:hypothetical protein
MAIVPFPGNKETQSEQASPLIERSNMLRRIGGIDEKINSMVSA